MTSKELVLSIMKRYGKEVAESVQENAPNMTGTELYKETNFIPDFNPNRQYLDYEPGYICKSPSGRIVQLIQPYDSTIYQDPPEFLGAQWKFYWSKDPSDAVPFECISTSPYMKGDCCEYCGVIYRSLIDNNIWCPPDYSQGWEVVE